MTSGSHRLRVVVSPDKFKGSLSAVEAAQAITDGLLRGCPGVEVVARPVADGGEGTVAAVVSAGYEPRTVTVSGPTGEPVTATFALNGESAVLELAEASGLRHLPGGGAAPLTASTFGTGEVIGAALDAGARKLVLGLGGSATTDGGAGMASALGARFLDATGAELPAGGGALVDLDRIDLDAWDPRLAETTVVLASDVDNPLVGPNGAAAVYGPQKGASPDDVLTLDAALRRYADVVERDFGVAIADVPGAGAAGGAGGGALAFLGARVESGIGLVLRVIGFADAILDADLVITGEGSLDAQSLSGKAPVGVALAARSAGVPVVALVGRLLVTPAQLEAVGIRSAHALVELEADVTRAQANAADLLARLAEDVGRSLYALSGERTP